MTLAYPSALVPFVPFLEMNGFVLEEERPYNGRTEHAIFRAHNLRVDLVCDIVVWGVEFCEDHKPERWYDLHFIMAVMTGTTGDDPISLEEYVAFAQSNWEAIVSLFSAENALQTHATMESFFRERRKRLYPEVKD